MTPALPSIPARRGLCLRRRLPAVFLLAATVALSATAGPLRERLQERVQVQRPAAPIEGDDGLQGESAQSDELGDGRGGRDSALPAGSRVLRDIAYAGAAAQRLDVYLPREALGAPVIVLVHGGGWRTGDKGARSVVQNKVRHWLPKGFIVVSVNYRLWPEADPLGQADDVARAVAFAQARASVWGGDGARFVLMGHSAGAHLVSLLAADPSIAARQGARPVLATVALDSAAFDLVAIMQSPRHPRLYDAVFGDATPAQWRQASPLHRLQSDPGPMLLVCSTQRNDACPQAQAFRDRAASLGAASVAVLPVDLGHRQINTDLGQDGRYTREVERFLRTAGLR